MEEPDDGHHHRARNNSLQDLYQSFFDGTEHSFEVGVGDPPEEDFETVY
jgi:hypothetical protein